MRTRFFYKQQFLQGTRGWNWQKVKQILSNTLRLNFCFLKIILTLHQRYHPKGRLINKKSIRLSKFNEVLNIMSKIISGCFLYWIKIADNMNEKKQQIYEEKHLQEIFDFNQWLGWNFLKRTVLTEQTH